MSLTLVTRVERVLILPINKSESGYTAKIVTEHDMLLYMISQLYDQGCTWDQIFKADLVKMVGLAFECIPFEELCKVLSFCYS
jgi:hypothetical protein